MAGASVGDHASARIGATPSRATMRREACAHRDLRCPATPPATARAPRDARGARMEFGIFIQGHLPGPQAHSSDAEHRVLFDEIELVKCADRNNWKYVWISEHHALTEYSHISASEVYAGYLAAVTD